VFYKEAMRRSNRSNPELLVVKEKPIWFKRLIEDLKRIIEEEEVKAHIEFCRVKHKIGRRILQEKEHIEWGEIGEFIRELSVELGYSERDLYYCIQFAERFPNFDDFLRNLQHPLQKLSWRFVCLVLLPGREIEAPPKLLRCLACGDEVGPEETKIFRLCRSCISDFQVWLAERP